MTLFSRNPRFEVFANELSHFASSKVPAQDKFGELWNVSTANQLQS
jgi:hypothetical protein